MKNLNAPESLDGLFIQDFGDKFCKTNKPRLGFFRSKDQEHVIAHELRTHNSHCDSFTNWIYLIKKLNSLPNNSTLAQAIVEGVNNAFNLNLDFSLPNAKITHLAMNAINKYYVLEQFHKEAFEINGNFDLDHPAKHTNLNIDDLHQLADGTLYAEDRTAANILAQADTKDSFLSWLKIADAYEQLSNHATPLARKMLHRFSNDFQYGPINLKANTPSDVADLMRDAIYNWYATEFRKEIRLQQGSVLTREYRSH